jgi:hypothetical protein
MSKKMTLLVRSPAHSNREKIPNYFYQLAISREISSIITKFKGLAPKLEVWEIHS